MESRKLNAGLFFGTLVVLIILMVAKLDYVVKYGQTWTSSGPSFGSTENVVHPLMVDAQMLGFAMWLLAGLCIYFFIKMAKK